MTKPSSSAPRRIGVGAVVVLIAAVIAVLIALRDRSETPDVPEKQPSATAGQKPRQMPRPTPAKGTPPPPAKHPTPAETPAAATTPAPVDTDQRWIASGQCTTPTYDNGEPVRPIPGAKVTLIARDDEQRELLRFATVTTDGDGRFEVNIDALRNARPVARHAVTWHAEVEKDDLAVVAGNMDRVPPPPPGNDRTYRPHLMLRLEAAIVVTGEVFDSQGQRAKNVVVQAVDEEGYEIWSVASSTGAFAHIVEEQTELSIYATGDDGISKPVTIHPTKPGRITLPKLVLERRRSIDGFAHYPDGTPARFLQLNLSATDEELPATIGRANVTVTTDRNGRFLAHGLGPGRYEIGFEVDIEPPTPIIVPKGVASADVEIPGRRLLVRSSVQGRPIGGVPIFIRRADDEASPPPERSDRDVGGDRSGVLLETERDTGLVCFSPPHDAEDYFLAVQCVGIMPMAVPVRFPRHRWEHVVTLALQPVTEACRLTIDFRDGRDQPIETPVELSLRADGQDVSMVGLRPQYDAQARIDGIAPGRYRIRAKTKNDLSFFRAVSEVITLLPGENRHVALMAAYGRIAASIRCQDGNTATLTAKGGRGPCKLVLHDADGRPIDAPTLREAKRRGDDVCIRSPALNPGTYHVRVMVGSRELVAKTVVVKRLVTTHVKVPLDR